MQAMKLFRFGAYVALASGVSTSAFQIQSPVYTTSSSRGSLSRLFSAVNAGFVDISEAAPRDIETMDEWAAECGVQRADGFMLVPTSEDSDDVSAMTTEDIPAGSPVLFIPAQMVFSANEAVEEYGSLPEAEKLLQSLKAMDQLRHFYLMLKILVEYERGQDSPWFPWLNSLPRYYSNGASMTPFCYECLPPLVASLAMEERSTFIYLQSAVKAVPFLSEETKADKDLCKWAFQIAYTRSFEANDEYGDLRIAPLADMFNHGTEVEVEIVYDEEGNCYAQSLVDIPAGSPLRMSYGDPTNPSFLFARYGFLDESSPATFCKIMIPHKNSQLEDMGYAHNRMLFYKDTGDVSEEVFDVLLYQILGEASVAKRREFYEAHMNGDYETKQAFHEQYWPETAAKLQEHVDKFLNQLDVLSSKGDGKDVFFKDEHPRLPLILAHNQFVKDTFLAVRERYFS